MEDMIIGSFIGLIGLIITVVGSTLKFSQRFSALERQLERVLVQGEGFEKRIMTLEARNGAVGELRDRLTRIETLCQETHRAPHASRSS